ncbi:MAG TPA: 3-dehydroquinate synthase, partial [Phycisphaerales bacterium]|nr:3-dehydroquinate synthase [Phycisphaerales bacterium]
MRCHGPIDVHFDHRVFFTRGVFEPGNGVLEDVLSGGADSTRDRASGGRQDGHSAHRGVVFIDDGVARAHPGLEAAARAKLGGLLGVDVPVRVVPGGERVKNDPSHLDDILRAIHDAHLCRHSYVFAVGGGAVLDAVGYAAAIAHRGVRLVRFPTTTLSQDDSGVGVKNGVNAFGKKNFLGVFAPPCAVINDTDFLKTLDDRDWRAGFSEAVKVALVRDGSFFDEIERLAPAIVRREMGPAVRVIERSALLHFRHIVEGGDPFETAEARPLDFGHWSAHKLEQLSGFELRHGEAVAGGGALDAMYSALAGGLPMGEAERVAACLVSLGFELDHPSLDDPALLDGLEEFREHLGGRLTVSLLAGIGSAVDVHEMDADLVRESIDTLRAFGPRGTDENK